MKTTYAPSGILIGVLLGVLIGLKAKSLVLGIVAMVLLSVACWFAIRFIEKMMGKGIDKVAEKTQEAIQKHVEQKQAQNGPAPVQTYEAPVQPFDPVSPPADRPAYAPPASVVPSAPETPAVHIDVSNVRPGTVVSHEAFGTGQVKGFDGGSVIVAFGSTEKRFQFPSAFEQGYLKL